MKLTKLDQLVSLTAGRKPKKLVVAAAQDREVLVAVRAADDNDLIEPVLVGNRRQIEDICLDIGYEISGITIHHIEDPVGACQLAVELISDGKEDILMKGMVSSAVLLKAVLRKKEGLRKRDLLSHFALIEVPGYKRLIGITDAGMNIQPDINEKVSIIQNAVEVYHRLGNNNPKVAILAPVEVVNTKIPSTLDASALQSMNLRNQIRGCIIDGPLALDNAISEEAASHKGIVSPVAGQADILLTPDLNSGNILYKSLIFLAGGTAAAVVMGARVPIVLTSRADSEKSKYMSIALAAAMDDQ